MTTEPEPEPGDYRLLAPGAVATLFGVSINTVRYMAKAQGLPHFRIGRQLRFRREKVLAWLEAQERGGEPPPPPSEAGPPRRGHPRKDAVKTGTYDYTAIAKGRA